MSKWSPSYQSLLGKSLFIISIRAGIIIANFIVFSYFAHHLSREDNGTYLILFEYLAIFTGLGAIGIGTVAFNYSAAAFTDFIRNLSVKNKLLYSLYILFVSVLFSIVLAVNKVIPASWITAICTGSLLLISILSFLLDNILLLYKKYRLQFLVNILYALAFIAIHLFAAKQDPFSLSLLIQFWSVILLVKLTAQSLLFRSGFKNSNTLLDSMIYMSPGKSTWLHLGFYEVFQLFVRKTDKLIVGFVASKEAAAIYFNGRLDIPLLPALLASVRNAAIMELGRAGQSTEQMIRVVRNTFAMLSTVAIGVVVFGWIYSYEIITVVFSDKYILSIPVFILSLLILPAQFCLSVSYLLQFREKGHIINKGAFLDLIITIILVYPLYLLWSYNGIVLAILLSTYIQSFYYLIHASKALRTEIVQMIPWKGYILKIIFFLPIAGISHWLYSTIFDPLFTLIAGGITGAACVAVWIMLERKKSVNP